MSALPHSGTTSESSALVMVETFVVHGATSPKQFAANLHPLTRLGVARHTKEAFAIYCLSTSTAHEPAGNR